ncbi:hypothetical protein QQS21_012562 [Conoideocrella luteorostrata]|uniref:CTLH domain-containing protein n=1 Tax=Conoideocrella luteorostrata TaxID=1105319 RepID=A0AAJ0CDP3_9HYPO|nr:hypothetical protein QQS21_012562 [Conoideocrella luteorostrata]
MPFASSSGTSPRLARGSVDVDQSSNSRSLHPIAAPDDPSTSQSPQNPTSTVLSALDLSSPSDHLDRIPEPAPVSTVNIESSTSRSAPPTGQASQVLGRRRRSSGSSALQEDPDSTFLGHEAVGTDTPALASRRSKRRRRDSSAMASDASSAPVANGSTAVRSNGASELASQRTVLPGGVTNGTHKATALATNGSSNGDKTFVPTPRPTTYFGHNREEVTRILIQALSDMGYQAAAESVSHDSGYKLESPTVASFRSAVLDGSWAEAEDLLTGATVSGVGYEDGDEGNGLVLAPGSNRDIMRFWLRQQKFLELLERKDTTRALHVLRTELTPLHHDTNKLHLLSSLLMCLSTNDLMAKANWDGARGQSRKTLLSELSRCISPSVMLPENRLAILLQQVKQSQIDTCLYHTAASSPSLYSDHLCDIRNFPTEKVVELEEVTGETWEVQFSHDGSKLAACGSGDAVRIWETRSFSVVNTLTIQVQKDHESGVASIAWSPDDSMIVTCSRDNFARLWDTKTGSLLKKLRRFDEPVSACVWAGDGESFILGTLDNKRSICTFNSEGEELVQWNKKHRVQALCASPNGRWLVAADNKTTIYVYNATTRELEYELDLKTQPTSLTISQDSRQLLINKADSEAQLIDLVTRGTIHKFLGHKMGKCIIRSAFGGANESFVVSGSEDGNMFIWHKNIGAAVERLPGHSKRCNGAAWNPADPCMLASCSDAGPIKIWSNRARGVDLRSQIPSLSKVWRRSSDVA